MDIRAYFSKKPSTIPKSSVNDSCASKRMSSGRRPVIDDSDSDDAFTEEKPKKKTPVKTTNKRRIINSSDDSENESPSKKSKTKGVPKRPRKLELSESSADETIPTKKRSEYPSNGTVTSKFFKRTTASAVFGDEPIKRSNTKLKAISAKLKVNGKPTEQDVPLIPDYDADFEATLAQLDEIGVDGWIPSSPKKESLKTKPDEMKMKDRSGKKSKQDILKRTIDESTLKIRDSSSSSNFDSGFDSQLSSDSQNLGENDSLHSESGSSKITIETKERPKRQSPRKAAMQTSPSTNLERIKDSFPGRKTVPKTNFCESVVVNKKTEESRVPSRETPVSASLNKTSSCMGENFRKPKTTLKSNDCKSDIKRELEKEIVELNDEHWLWVEKHKPTNTKKIIGQQGDKSNVNKLTNWLNNWYKNNSGSKKAVFVPNGWNKDTTGSCFKAALLSGPPGVGKTTSVNLVCKELGFDMVEFNASDTRSKKLLQDEVSRLLSNTSLSPYFSKEGSKETVTKKHVLVMDEVDGMAGNEDRGGVQELIQLIKITRVPIICMCNDRNHPKIRSLVNYCFDLRFSRPRVEQIKGYMRSVCFKEKLNIGNEALTDIITSANSDIRLILNHLSMLAADTSNLEAAKKYIKLSAWDVLRKVFSKEEHKNMNINEKCDLFFFDYNIAPLFVQENYLTVKPLNVDANDKREKMELFARAADCISRGDLIDKNIRQNMAWSLLPTQAVFSSYAPGEILEGYCGGQINFPSWLGKNSKQNRLDRLLQEIQIHTRLKLSASKESINLDYASHLRDQIIGPLVREGSNGVKSTLEMLHEYHLLKDDLENLQEICQWPNSINQWASLDSKVKAALTRTYNKNPPVRPYSLVAPVKKGVSNTLEDLELADEENEEETKSDDENDAMIITKKKTQSEKKGEQSVPSSSKKVAPKNSKASKSGRKK